MSITIAVIDSETLKLDPKHPERVVVDEIGTVVFTPSVQSITPAIIDELLEKAFDGTGWRPDQPLPVARELGETSLMFLVHPTLTDAEVERCVVGIESVLRQAITMEVG